MPPYNKEVRWHLSFLLVGVGFGIQFGTALKVPVRLINVLPVLPRQVSWPVLSNIHSAVDLLPQYIGSLAPENGTIKRNAACFFENEAKIEFTGTGDRGIGGSVIHLSDLGLHEILAETEKRGITFDQLLTIPEKDECVYSDGKSTTRVAFILAMYKGAGVLVWYPIPFRDAYMLKIFENAKQLAHWCNNEADQLPFCQLLGEYKMELPHYNTLEAYAERTLPFFTFN